MPTNLAITPYRVRGMTGDTLTFSFTLYADGSPANLTGYSIQSAVRNMSKVMAIGPYTQSSSASGANWGSGIVVVTIPYPDTEQLFENTYYLDILTYQSSVGYRTWPLVRLDLDQYTIAH